MRRLSARGPRAEGASPQGSPARDPGGDPREDHAPPYRCPADLLTFRPVQGVSGRRAGDRSEELRSLPGPEGGQGGSRGDGLHQGELHPWSLLIQPHLRARRREGGNRGRRTFVVHRPGRGHGEAIGGGGLSGVRDGRRGYRSPGRRDVLRDPLRARRLRLDNTPGAGRGERGGGGEIVLPVRGRKAQRTPRQLRPGSSCGRR